MLSPPWPRVKKCYPWMDSEGHHQGGLMGILDKLSQWWKDMTTPAADDGTWVGDNGYVYNGTNSYGDTSQPASTTSSSGFGGSSGGNWGSGGGGGGNTWVGDGGYIYDGTSAYGQTEPAKQEPKIAAQAQSAPQDTWIGDGGFVMSATDQYNPAGGVVSGGPAPSFITEDNEAYSSYMDYYNDRNANPDAYNDGMVNETGMMIDPEYIAKYLHGSGDQLVDDGTNSYLNRTSHYITGAEAKKQAEYFGNQELASALADVKDNAIISKSSLRQYGYTPFVDSSNPLVYAGSKTSQVLNDAGEASEEFWNKIGNWRNDNADWTVVYNGVELSGKAVDQAIADSIEKGFGGTDEDGRKMPPNAAFDARSAYQREDGMWVVPVIINVEEMTRLSEQYPDGIPDDVWNAVVQHGDSFAVDETKFPDGYSQGFEPAVVEVDGETIEIPQEAWIEVCKNHTVAEHLADMMMPNGLVDEKLKLADEIFDNMGGQPGGNRVEFGFGGVMAPGYLSGEVLGSPYWASTLVNGALSSAAYFNPYSLAERTSLAGGMSASGVDATSQTRTSNGIRSYLPAKSNLANISGAVLAPVAESYLGSVGGKGDGIFKMIEDSMIRRANPRAKLGGLGEFAQDAINEGLEEVVTDPLYEIQSNAGDAYADERLDENGYQTFDDYGRPQYLATPVQQRVRNYARQQPDNFILGSAIGGAMNAGRQAPAAARYAAARIPITQEGRARSDARKRVNDFFSQQGGARSGLTKAQATDMFAKGIVRGVESREDYEDRIRGLYMNEVETGEEELEPEVRKGE